MKTTSRKQTKAEPVSDLDDLFDFPCRFPVKAMGRKGPDFEQLVTEIILRHAEMHADGGVSVQPSGAGNFLSVTVVIEAVSREQLDLIYKDLTDCEQVMMAL
jgi:putative lipoic acid-binding regulatory protein